MLPDKRLEKYFTPNTHRGKIKHRERAKQIIDFSGLVHGSITPTDIDGIVEYNDKAFLVYEIKMDGVPIQRGQKIALERMANRWFKGGAHAIVFLCRHFIVDPHMDIDASVCVVDSFFMPGFSDKWEKSENAITLLDSQERFIQYVDKQPLLNP